MKKVIALAVLSLFIVAGQDDSCDATKKAEETTNQTGE